MGIFGLSDSQVESSACESLVGEVDLDGSVFELFVEELFLLLFTLLLVVVLFGEGVELFVQSLQLNLILIETAPIRLNLPEHPLHLLTLLPQILLIDGYHLLLLHTGLPLQNLFQILQFLLLPL